MQFSRDWLARYVELPDDIAVLSERLTLAGLAVEGIEERGGDVLLEIDVTTNRPDCMNHLGLAREVAVLFGRRLEVPAAELDESAEKIAEAVEIGISDADCSRYAARVVRDVVVAPSPEWLVRSLESIDLRPINNVVDVTNFVLWEWGQPIHAFDLDTLAGPSIDVRSARSGERLETLDGETRELEERVLVIADGERAVALAGIMGGLATEVTEKSRNVLIESAHFNPSRVRRGADLLGMHTDASHRFERGADPGACRAAADRVASLLAEIAGGKVLAGALDITAGSPEPALAGSLDARGVSRFAGVDIAPEEIERSLAGLGFEPRPEGGGWKVTVPTWRHYDFSQTRKDGTVWAADLYEEVLRLHGFDRIPSALPPVAEPDPGSSSEHELRQGIRAHLAASGFLEAINWAFHSASKVGAYPSLAGSGEPLLLANPLSENHAAMRASLLPGLMESARYNQRRGAAAVQLFEIGRLFPAGGPEIESVALVAGGTQGTAWERPLELDLFDLKGVVESLCDDFGRALATRRASLPGFIEGTAAELLDAGGEVIGFLGQAEADDLDSDYPLYGVELLTSALAGSAEAIRVRVPSRFPAVAADLTLTLPLELSWERIVGAIREVAPPELRSWRLKVRYEGEGVPPGAVNTTISFLYNADDRSLTQDEVNEWHGRMTRELESRFALAPDRP